MSVHGAKDYGKLGNLLKDVLTEKFTPTYLKSLRVLKDNSGGSTPKVEQLVTSSVESKHATILYPIKLVLDDFTEVDQTSSPPILIGDSERQEKTMYPGDKIETNIRDLSKVHVKVPAEAKVYLEVIYEV